MAVNVNINGVDTLNSTCLYGTVSTVATVALVTAAQTQPSASANARQLLEIHNPNAAASLAFTFDGTTPVINGAGYTLSPTVNRTATYDIAVPQGPVTVIGSTVGTLYTITVI